MKETVLMGADAMFQQYTIKEIRDIERKLRNDIEKKKEDLRQMVGERYRDLIDAADTITEMKASAESVTKHIKLIEGHCSQLQATTRPSGIFSNATCRDEKRNNEKIQQFTLAAKLKVLMDVPTMLWSSVESNNFLAAAQLFLLAQHIHSSLLLESSHHFHGLPLLTKFPVIRHQSSLIGQFRSFISEKCRLSLKQDHLTNKELTDILCCILLLEDTSLTNLFKEFLSVRLKVIDNMLKLNKKGATAKSQVCEVVQLIVNTIQLVSSVFARNSKDNQAGDTECSVFQILNSIVDKNAEGPVSYLQDKISLSFTYLPAHVKNYRPTVKSTLEPILQSSLQDLMKQWIDNVKDVVHLNLGGLLQYIPSIKGLALILETVEQKLAEVEHDALQRDCVCILNENLSIYDVLLKKAFVERVKDICKKNLENAFLDCEKNINKCLQKIIERHPDMVDENVTRYVWKEPTNSLTSQNTQTATDPVLYGDGTLAMKASRHTPEIQRLCKSFDESLQFLLDDLNFFGNGDQCTRNYDAEVLELRQYLLESTRARFRSLLKFMKDMLTSEALKKEPYIGVWPPYLGRLCHAFVELCEHAKLCLILEDPFATRISASSAAKKDNVFQEVKAEILQLGDDSFRCWYHYLVECFTRKLHSSLGDCSPANFLQNVLEWEEIEIQEETEDGKVIKSVIRVPIQASSFLQSALFSMCQDVNNATGHVMNKSVTRELDRELFQTSLSCYSDCCIKLQAQTSLAPRLVQTIALQMLFDLRLLSELLCPQDDSEMQEKTDAATSALESLIDPFDLDVFNPSLQLNLTCALQRSVMLLGLIRSENSAPSSSQRLASQNQPPNLLSLSANASRFLLLPIASKKSENVMSASMKEDLPTIGKGVMSRSFGSSPNFGQTENEAVTKSYSFYDRMTAMGSSWFGTGN